MIDFIMVSYKNTEYVKLALESMERFTKTPHRVTLIENGTDLDRYKEIYKDKDNYQILKGPQNGVWKKPGDGSKNHSAGLTMGMKNTDNPIVCFLDSDILFLDYWEDDILPLLENNFLSSPERLFYLKKILFEENLIPLKFEKFIILKNYNE